MGERDHPAAAATGRELDELAGSRVDLRGSLAAGRAVLVQLPPRL